MRAVAWTTLALVAFASTASAADPVPDFLFGQPTRSVSVRANWVLPREGADLFAFIHDQLTIDKGDFKTAMAVVGEGGLAINSRVTLVLGVDVSRSSVGSEYRHFIGNDNLPISQQSTLMTISGSGSVKIALTQTGRRIGRYAWIPRTVAPYVGAGGGIVHYRFKQTGDFVDYVDHSVFNDTFVSSGLGPTAHVFAGADIHAWRNMFVTLEGRYVWAHAKVGQDFVGFNRIDLSGFRMSSGVNFVF